MQRNASRRVWLAAALVVMASASSALAQPPKIVPVEQSYLGLGYGDWAGLWWQWAFSIPDGASHPFSAGGDVLQNQAGHVWFLAGVFGVEERTITIPAGTALFFPVGNAECSTLEPDPFHGDDAPSLSACANGYGDLVAAGSPSCELDGKPVNRLGRFRTQSSMFAFGPLPDPAVFGLTPGDTGLAVDSGIYLLLEPMSPGEHTIHFTAYDGGIDTTYDVTVEE